MINQFTPGKAPEHSMTEGFINAANAREIRSEFLKHEAAIIQKFYTAYVTIGDDKYLKSAALHFGMFSHPLHDSTSPAHQDQDNKVGDGMKNWNIGDAHHHGPSPFSIEKEKHITPELRSLTRDRINSAIDEYKLPIIFKAK
jgi:hypothetical protein